MRYFLGLAGGYNANVFRFVRTLPEADIVPIGKRACDRFGGGSFQAESFRYQDAIALSRELCRQYTDGAFDRLGIVSTAYRSMLTQEPQVNWVLPLAREESGHRQSVVFEPDERSMLEAVVPEYVAGLLIAAVRESYASEVAARRNAMDSAGKNAQQMIDDLQLSYNRARQSAITQEITEIVAGAGD